MDSLTLAYGELLWDVLPDGKVLGGAPANFGYRLHALGMPVKVISSLGEDALGEEAMDLVRSRGVDVSLLQTTNDYPTGTVDVVLSDTGSPDYTINTGVAYDNIVVTDALLEDARSAKLLCFGTLVQRAERSRETLYALMEAASGATKLLDINLRKDCFSANSVTESLRAADILKLNDDEVPVVSELLGLDVPTPKEFVRNVTDTFEIQKVLVTLGEKGVYGYERSTGEEVDVPGVQVDVADTIGSGDAFTAGFAYKFLSGAGFEDCCEFGNKLGALTATKAGGMPEISQEEIAKI